MIKKKEEKSLKYTTSQHSLQRAHLRFALFLPAMQQKLYHSYYMLCSIPTTKSSERIRSWNYVDLRFFLSVSSSSFLYFSTSQKKSFKKLLLKRAIELKRRCCGTQRNFFIKYLILKLEKISWPTFFNFDEFSNIIYPWLLWFFLNFLTSNFKILN